MKQSIPQLQPRDRAHPLQDSSTAIESEGALRRFLGRAQRELDARFSRVEWVMLAFLVALTVAFIWRFASSSFFFLDDLAHLYWAQHSGLGWSYAFDPAWGHLVPGFRLTFFALYRIAPMNFEAALAILVACQTISAVLLQRILALLFGRTWWTYALALIWGISIIYLLEFNWFAAGLHRIPSIAATLASIHGYLCWRATGRRAWLTWSVVAMVIGLAFYEKALLIPVYLLLMRILLLDPAAPLRDSLRSVANEWRVWLAYATVCAAFLLLFALGNYQRAEIPPVGEILSYLRVFWVEGFSPMLFGVRIPEYGHTDWHRVMMLTAQLALVGLVVWSIARRRTAWRAWAFLLIAVAVNMLAVVGRVSQIGAEGAGYLMLYYTEPGLFVPLAIAFAFAVPRLRARVAAIESAEPAHATARWYGFRKPPIEEETELRLPTARIGAAALVALTAYVGVTWATAEALTKPWGGEPFTTRLPSGQLARSYFDNLRADLAARRQTGLQPSLLDHDVPEWVQGQIGNVETLALREGVRYTLLSSVVPLFDRRVTFDQPGPLYIVQPDGHLKRTRFVPASGVYPEELRGEGQLRISEARVERRGGESCVVGEGLGATLEWEPRPPLIGHDWWLRAGYRTDPVVPLRLESNAGVGWAEESVKLPPMGDPGTVIIPLSELPAGLPGNAGVRLSVAPRGRLCIRSLEIGFFDPPAPSATAGVGPG